MAPSFWDTLEDAHIRWAEDLVSKLQIPASKATCVSGAENKSTDSSVTATTEPSITTAMTTIPTAESLREGLESLPQGLYYQIYVAVFTASPGGR